MTINAKIEIRYDTLDNWNNTNPVLAKWEIWAISDNWTFKVWDWQTAFKDLPISLSSSWDQSINWNLTISGTDNWILFPDWTKQKSASAGWWIDTVIIAWDQVQWTMIYEFDADKDSTVWNVSVSLQTPPSWQDFIVTWYNNWTSVWTTTIATNATATNWRYKTVTTLNTALVADDVFTWKITQTWSDQPGSDLAALINIS